MPGQLIVELPRFPACVYCRADALPTGNTQRCIHCLRSAACAHHRHCHDAPARRGHTGVGGQSRRDGGGAADLAHRTSFAVADRTSQSSTPCRRQHRGDSPAIRVSRDARRAPLDLGGRFAPACVVHRCAADHPVRRGGGIARHPRGARPQHDLRNHPGSPAGCGTGHQPGGCLCGRPRSRQSAAASGAAECCPVVRGFGRLVHPPRSTAACRSCGRNLRRRRLPRSGIGRSGHRRAAPAAGAVLCRVVSAPAPGNACTRRLRCGDRHRANMGNVPRPGHGIGRVADPGVLHCTGGARGNRSTRSRMRRPWRKW